jgi:hypothetical protein
MLIARWSDEERQYLSALNVWMVRWLRALNDTCGGEQEEPVCWVETPPSGLPRSWSRGYMALGMGQNGIMHENRSRVSWRWFVVCPVMSRVLDIATMAAIVWDNSRHFALLHWVPTIQVKRATHSKQDFQWTRLGIWSQAGPWIAVSDFTLNRINNVKYSRKINLALYFKRVGKI